MSIRGSKVGDVVSVEPMRGHVLVGTIVSIDSQDVRCVATADGFHYATPTEMTASDEPDQTKPIEAIEPGDVVVLFEGTRRTVVKTQRRVNPPVVRMIFDERPFAHQDSPAGRRWRVEQTRSAR